jgi:hypothetical protein
LAKFKTKNANQFKAYDSAFKLHQITEVQQRMHDSLMKTGVNLAMKFVKNQMTINDLKKDIE